MDNIRAKRVISGFFGEYRFLSNFWDAPVRILGISYKSTEAAYQAGKTDDLTIRELFSHLDPKAAKRMGKTIGLRPGWNDVIKVELMELCLRAKFNIPHLRSRLISTAPLELIETNSWHDTFWGVCDGKGQNMMGKLLMNLRDELILYEPQMRAVDSSEQIPF